MKITYFGTAAAEGLPAPFCSCPVCQEAQKLGGKNVRTRSQALVDDSLLLDFPADTYAHCLAHGLSLLQVTDLLVTHSHSDHWYPGDLFTTVEPFGHHREDYVLTLHGNETVCSQFTQGIGAEDPRVAETVQAQVAKAFQPFSAGEYRVTPIPADHCYTENALFYLIEKGEEALLYAHDTGYFLDSVWEYLAGRKDLRLGLASLDCTHGIHDQWKNHMSLAANVQVRDRLIDMGIADEKTLFVANHFSHNGGSYGEICNKAAELGLMVSYDGMAVTF